MSRALENISASARVRLCRVYISRSSITMFLRKLFSLLIRAAWSHPWGGGCLFSMHLYSDAEIYRGQKMWKQHEQKARSSVCVLRWVSLLSWGYSFI